MNNEKEHGSYCLGFKQFTLKDLEVFGVLDLGNPNPKPFPEVGILQLRTVGRSTDTTRRPELGVG